MKGNVSMEESVTMKLRFHWNAILQHILLEIWGAVKTCDKCVHHRRTENVPLFDQPSDGSTFEFSS
jgi:hypothetical protein